MDSSDIEVLSKVVVWLNSGEEVCLATVAKTYGSSPRPLGALLAITASGRFAGSVSGGCVDQELFEIVTTNFPKQPQVLLFGKDKQQATRLKLPCGGVIEIVVEPIVNIPLFEDLLAAIKTRRRICRKLDITTGQSVIQNATNEHEFLFDGKSLVTVFGARWRMLVIGAGETSQYLAQFANVLDYQLLVCDPRVEYRREWHHGGELLADMPDDVVNNMQPDQRTVIIALTHDPKLDDLAIMEALRSDAFYVGALGSQRTNKTRRERLQQHFNLTPHELGKLHGPVGLPLGSRTPAEIALSIMAEITANRHGMTLVKKQRESVLDKVSNSNI